MIKQILKKVIKWLGEFFVEIFNIFRNFFKLRTTPGKKVSPFLVNLIFVSAILFYGIASSKRHEVNPKDKLVPTFGMMWTAVKSTVFIPKIEYKFNDSTGERMSYIGPETLRQAISQDIKDYKEGKYHSIFHPINSAMFFKGSTFFEEKRSILLRDGATRNMLNHGESKILKDSIVSGRIVLKAMGLILIGIFLGLYMGIFAYIEKLLYRFVLYFDKIPALAILPILFVILGTGEITKIALIVIGVAPTIILDTYLRVKTVHDEQIVTGLTLGASTPEIIYKIVFPQIFPEVLNTIRLNFKSVILFLLAAEGICANAGIGYRIFVAQRTTDMATIIPYVLLISLAAFFVDWAFRSWIKSYKWLNK